MQELLNLICAALIISTLLTAASTRLKNYLVISCFQGIAVTIVALLNSSEYFLGLLILIPLTIMIKGGVIPFLLGNSMTVAQVRREIEPLINYSMSIMIVLLGLLFSLWLASQLPLAKSGGGISKLMLTTPLFMIFVGFFIIISRTKAITGTMGLLMIVNGIYLFGAILNPRHNLIIELGFLLDTLVIVFIVGIAMFKINRQFDHIEGRLEEFSNEETNHGEKIL